MKTLLQTPVCVTFDGAALPAHAARALRDEALAACLKKEAEREMSGPLYCVTERKPHAPSGDPRDYASCGPYWWPDPDKPDGLPYIRRDGVVNPDTEETTHTFLRMFRRVWALALAAFCFDRADMAERAAAQIEAWYLDPVTGMNPHLRYGQGVPGICEGRCFGLIDCRDSYKLFDAVGLLDAMGWLPEETREGVRRWYGAFLDWMLTSEIGVDEDARLNNHGTWYDVQVMAAALFLDRPLLFSRTREAAWLRRACAQVEKDGRQPQELARTNAFGYSLMNLTGLCLIGQMGRLHPTRPDYRREGVDFFRAERDGRSPLLAAADFLAPYALGGEPWPYEQIGAAPEAP
ncbi:MAG: alginate lyase family protein, partial [Clostridia bacterium]|nr:alginate lyase family protein [Clostridia bacterium]